MYPVPGHLAVSVVGKRYFNIGWIALLAGTFLPDLIDKPLNDIFHITPYGRCIMHSLAGLAAVTMLTYALFGEENGFAYFIGHVGHLLGDSDFNPWFWPFISYDWPTGIDITEIPSSFFEIFVPSWIFYETLLLGLAGLLFTRYGKQKHYQIAILVAFIAIAIFRISRQRL